MKKLTIIQPDDCHLHLRDGVFLSRTVSDAALRFGRAVIMPNLKPPVTNVTLAAAYRQRILAARPKGSMFEPLMTLYLTDHTTIDDIKAAKASGFIIGCKLYPAGATTNSAAGVTAMEKIYPVLAAMEEVDLPLLIHGEVTHPEIDIFARETAFIEQQLIPLLARFPSLRLVLEHVSSKAGVDWIIAAPKNVAATITSHHLLLNRNDLLAGGLCPHLYCLPILKTLQDQQALVTAAISGNPKFFLGTDSAPHAKINKECACANAGIYTAHAGIELYAEVFSHYNALDKLENFASRFGAEFYRLPLNSRKITLQQQSWQVPAYLNFGDEELVPLRGNEIITWKLSEYEQ